MDDLLAILNQTGGVLLDIRYSPRSRRPGFSRSGFERAIGDRYAHLPELGNVDYKGDTITISDPEVGLEVVRQIAEEIDGPIFLMCACEDAVNCHRSDVGGWLREEGYTVKEWGE